MSSETEIIISFLFKRSGKEELSFSELYLTLSMDLNWFNPDSAKDFINNAVKNKILEKKKNTLSPNFDFKKVEVPLGFLPSKNVLSEQIEEKKEESAYDELFAFIIKEKKLDKEKIIQRITDLSNEKNITKEVAILLLGKELDISLDSFFEKVEKTIFTKNKE